MKVRAPEGQDPAGHMWTIATRIEETTEDQRLERWSKALSQRIDKGST